MNLILVSTILQNLFVRKYFVKQIQKGIIPDPAMMDPITGEPLPQEGGGDPMSMGEQQIDPDMEAEAQAVDAQYQKDTKKAEL